MELKPENPYILCRSETDFDHTECQKSPAKFYVGTQYIKLTRLLGNTVIRF